MTDRLRRMAMVILNIGHARNMMGSWRVLFHHLANAGGLRLAYDFLLEFLTPLVNSLYEQWIAKTESSYCPHLPADLVLVVSFAHLDAEELDYFVARLRMLKGEGTVFVDDSSPHSRDGISLLNKAGISAVPVSGKKNLDVLPENCIGIVFIARSHCPNIVHVDSIFKALREGADMVYGDEDRINAQGSRSRPYFKPDFSIDLFIYEDYLSGCIGISRRIWDERGWWDFDNPYGSIFDLLDKEAKIEHLPLILSHRFARFNVKSVVPLEQLRSFLKKNYGCKADIQSTAKGWTCRFGRGREFVTVIIPTRDRLELLQDCVSSLYATNDPDRFEVIVVDNRSIEPSTLDWLAKSKRELRNFQVVTADIEFNWSRLNNLAISQSTGNVFVLLNNDTRSRTPNWLDRMAEYATRRDVGTVGAQLLYENGTIQHAGVVVGYGGCADHVYRGIRPSSKGHMYISPETPRNVSAVTGACLGTSRRVIDSIGRFDEKFRVSFSDVEFCLRAQQHGFLNVYAADVVLYHFESQSRAKKNLPGDEERMRRVVSVRLPRDPYYNDNLSLDSLYPNLRW